MSWTKHPTPHYPGDYHHLSHCGTCRDDERDTTVRTILIKAPTVPEPDMEQYMRDTLFGARLREATDGCGPIEPDGTCEHGYPSWELYWGVI